MFEVGLYKVLLAWGAKSPPLTRFLLCLALSQCAAQRLLYGVFIACGLWIVHLTVDQSNNMSINLAMMRKRLIE